jgi:cell division protease FtsH
MDRMLSTLLVELDGVDSEGSCSMAVIGITHDASWIDPALLRPGRLDKSVHLYAPDTVEDTCEIAMQALQGVDSLDCNAVARRIAECCRGKTGATIKAVCDDIKFRLAMGQIVTDDCIVDILARRQ